MRCESKTALAAALGARAASPSRKSHHWRASARAPTSSPAERENETSSSKRDDRSSARTGSVRSVASCLARVTNAATPLLSEAFFGTPSAHPSAVSATFTREVPGGSDGDSRRESDKHSAYRLAAC